MPQQSLINWLLEGDVAIQFQVNRDLLDDDRHDLKKRIVQEGWGAQLLAAQRENGHWGHGFYQPKWTSTHYTLLLLRNLCIEPALPQIQKAVNLVADTEKGADGGVNPSRSLACSDVCVSGMFLNYACYFHIAEDKLTSIVDFLLSQRVQDGGFNCDSTRREVRHSSLHSTLSVIEGIAEYRKNGYTYRLNELTQAERSSREFILIHRLYLSDRTGKVIKASFLKFPFPPHWYYDILRALDYLQDVNAPWDERMQPAIEVLLKKRTKESTWKQYAQHPGDAHFAMEKAGKPGRWNTLRALRVMKHFGVEM